MAHKHQNNNEIIDEVMGKFSPNLKNHKIKRNCKMFFKKIGQKITIKSEKFAKLSKLKNWKIKIGIEKKYWKFRAQMTKNWKNSSNSKN
jgi:hypothetical protein